MLTDRPPGLSTASFTPVTVTVCAVFQLLVVNISVFWLPVLTLSVSTVTPVPAVNVTVTSSVGCVSSTTVYVPVPPSSATDSVSGASVTGAVTVAVPLTWSCRGLECKVGCPNVISKNPLEISQPAAAPASRSAVPL